MTTQTRLLQINGIIKSPCQNTTHTSELFALVKFFLNNVTKGSECAINKV
jgi:hypothetical protein